MVKNNSRSFLQVLNFITVFCMVVVPQSAKAEEFTNFLDMTFVTIPSGSFHMGAKSQQSDAQFDELPQHKVEVSGFQIMSTEVTLEQFKRYIIESSNIKVLRDDFMSANSHDNHAPVVFISWNDVRTFLHWLNKNKPASDKGKYRLPTEAEWEYACRAGKDTLYCGSNTASQVAWYTSKTVVYQQPVAQKKPNAFGLYDMSGNAREWVKDCYHKDYDSAPNDAREWTKNCKSNKHVTRGGSWNEGPQSARATDRLAVRGSSRSPTIGFRAVRELTR